MKIKYLIFAGACLVVSANASAATIVKSYVLNATFANGPLASVTSSFTVSFDPTVDGGAVALLSYTSNGGPYYTVPAAAVKPSAGFPGFIGVGGVIEGVNYVVSNTDDFVINFRVDSSGNLRPGYSTDYSVAALNSIYSANVVSLVDMTAGVPEPATWAMMIVGFGLVGGTMRRRTTKVAYAR